jgi:hypothetical protein
VMLVENPAHFRSPPDAVAADWRPDAPSLTYSEADEIATAQFVQRAQELVLGRGPGVTHRPHLRWTGASARTAAIARKRRQSHESMTVTTRLEQNITRRCD